ncbi:MAG TPA: bifunctional hydroxymethylpyrimidine kinase/phosphomethylpyrimidine kinase [Plantibacter sp.]|uniref:bifunctional hydroxymethylpyrimidine kinase/phosphomethylpyrimidine kinase n=1 Tax=unclassified Plantibacter TaxID=2624265 RepID=UPI002C46D3A9|nr:bifunctional hydroxymethylpyrimidine kinase/phosphomethylpyrimidine kinase [Plantibacter sp.]
MSTTTPILAPITAADTQRPITPRTVPRVLSIAGTDPTGGAGIQADLKSIAANGGYGMAVVTALVAQNTHGVRSVHVPPIAFLREQLDAVSDDVVIDAVKIGMLGDATIIEAVRSWLEETPTGPVVLDPVMVATSGDRLLQSDAEAAMRALLPFVDLVTPNLPELAVLAGEPVAASWAQALVQAQAVSARCGTTVLVKGGHLTDSTFRNEHEPRSVSPSKGVPDALVDAAGRLGDGRTVVEFTGPRIATLNTHGTGCSLSSAMATLVAQSGSWAEALETAKAWLTSSLEHADALEVGSGNGPINHFAALWTAAGIGTSESTVAARGSAITASWWDDIVEVRERIDRLPFVQSLADESLDPARFAWYLRQDAIYLRAYARVLARASALAPEPEEQVFWAKGAVGSIEAEMELHRSWSSAYAVDGMDDDASSTTTAYLDHLHASTVDGDYGTVVAALLPCYWIYQDLGERLVGSSHEGHPYAAWLDTYADPSFAVACDRAVEIVGRAAARADAGGVQRMRRAFLASAAHEEAFFAEPLR